MADRLSITSADKLPRKPSLDHQTERGWSSSTIQEAGFLNYFRLADDPGVVSRSLDVKYLGACLGFEARFFPHVHLSSGAGG